MIPRTVQMAAEVMSQFTSGQLEDYGNIILNGYSTTGPNSSGKMSWAWPDSPLLPAVPLPSLTSTRPAFRGWTTNYFEYYTKLQPNGYGVNPGDPTMFTYSEHSFTQETGPILVLGGNGTWVTPGTGYTPGTYTGVALTGGTGTGATADIVVEADPDPLVVGYVKSVTLVAPGIDYTPGDSLSAVIPGGTGFAVIVGQVVPVAGTGNVARWARAPRRFYQNQVAAFVPPTPNQQAIPYSYMYPVADTLTPPPIDTLS